MDASGELGQQGQGSQESKHSSCSLFAILLFPFLLTVCLFSPPYLMFQWLFPFLFSLPHSHYLPLSVLFICSPSQASICPLAAINQRWMEVPARPVRASAVSGRELQACPVATHSLCHPSAHQAAHPAVQQGSRCSHINLLHFTFFNILNAFASQLHRYSQGSSSVTPFAFTGNFSYSGQSPGKRIYHRQIKLGFPSLFSRAC